MNLYEEITQKKPRADVWSWDIFFNSVPFNDPGIYCQTKEEAKDFARYRAAQQHVRNLESTTGIPYWNETWWDENAMGTVFFAYEQIIIRRPGQMKDFTTPVLRWSKMKKKLYDE